MFEDTQQTTCTTIAPSGLHNDEFELYASQVEKGIRRERHLTLKRLNYIQQLREPKRIADDVEECVAKIDLPLSEDMNDSDSAILLSAIEDGNFQLIKQFLEEMKPDRRKQILTERLATRNSATFLQLAIQNECENVFREFRVCMDLKTKQEVTNSRDEAGNTALHYACLANKLSFVQSLLANFKRSDRPELILKTNQRGDNCLHLAARYSSSDIFCLLLKQLHDDKTRWQGISVMNHSNSTVGHELMEQVNSNTHTIFKQLCPMVVRQNKIKEFLFPPKLAECKATLLHSLVSNGELTEETMSYATQNLSWLFDLAKSIKLETELVWRRKVDEQYALPIYYLAALRNQTKHIKGLCDNLLSRVEADKVSKYIMSRDARQGRTAIHAAAHSNNSPVLQTFFKYLPYCNRVSFFLTKSEVGGSTPLHLAAGQADLTFKDILTSFDSNDCQQLILSKDEQDNTPILIAFVEGNIDVVNSLMSEKWVPRGMIFPLMTARNRFGWTIIHLSCIRMMGDSLTVSVLKFFKSMRVVNVNLMIHHADHNGNTVLHLAALLYRPKLVEAVLQYLKPGERKAFLAKRNKDGLMASQLCNMPEIVIVKYLQPLVNLGWSNEALIAKRDSYEFKSQTQITLRRLEKANSIAQPSGAACETEELNTWEDVDWNFDYF
ncbi:hypothetical protein EB796_009021 [Bugula neritina]|uniref:Uncharacterized protein n=1 Tax=Bugula neritina TaxID=10212 RepID=A0A7J7K213_BUGNE|nr:hypothetical protein EB796_009021 [Bugula neritina]